MNEDTWENSPFPQQYTEPQIAEILRLSPLADVAREMGIDVQEQPNGTRIARCPWCRQPTFVVDANDSWMCTSCAEGGRDVIILVCKMRDLWRADAIHWLAQRAGLNLAEQRVTDASLDEIRRSLPLLAVVKDESRPVTMAGNDAVTICPACHEPRCVIYTASNTFTCRSCEASGDVLEWTMLFIRGTIRGAAEHLAGLHGITLTYEDA